MKKHLISTSAIALGVAMAAPVAAQEWDVSVGGFMKQHIGIRDVSTTNLGNPDFDGVQFHSSSEIIFTPSITLDNGLTFGARVDVEGENKNPDGNEIDESFMFISSDTLGKIEVGSTNSVGYKLSVGAPAVGGMAINSPSISTFIPFSNAYFGGFRQAGLSSYTEVAGNNDVQRLNYFTPSFNGLTLGVSYAPTGELTARNNFGDPKTKLHDIFDIGANYDQTFGTTSVTLSARYGTGSRPSGAPGSDPSTWAVGAQVGFGDFTIGGSYAENDNGQSGLGNSTGWSLGGTYDVAGPWALEAVTYQGRAKDSFGDKGKYEAYRVGATRDMGPGVNWDVYVAHVKADDGAAVGKLKMKGTVLGTGINLSF